MSAHDIAAAQEKLRRLEDEKAHLVARATAATAKERRTSAWSWRRTARAVSSVISVIAVLAALPAAYAHRTYFEETSALPARLPLEGARHQPVDVSFSGEGKYFAPGAPDLDGTPVKSDKCTIVVLSNQRYTLPKGAPFSPGHFESELVCGSEHETFSTWFFPGSGAPVGLSAAGESLQMTAIYGMTSEGLGAPTQIRSFTYSGDARFGRIEMVDPSPVAPVRL